MLMLGGVAGFLYAAHIYDETDNELHGFFDLLGTFNALQFGKLSLLVALFFFFERFVNRKNSFFAYFAKISFGLFFIHGFYVVLFAKLMQRWFVVNPLVSLMAEMALVLIGSVLTVALVKKLLGARSRYVIGC
jgi:hypothetical protein